MPKHYVVKITKNLDFIRLRKIRILHGCLEVNEMPNGQQKFKEKQHDISMAVIDEDGWIWLD